MAIPTNPITSRIPRLIKSKPVVEELGFGKNVTVAGRMMNADGSFNVVRESESFWSNSYYHLVTMPWWQFLGLCLLVYLTFNSLFALGYLAIGIDSLAGVNPGSFGDNYLAAFFFSTQTLTTVGYGTVSPVGIPANMLASFEAFCGLLSFALVSGLLYGRFSRPKAKILFSEKLLVSPYRDGKGIMFRMMNAQRSELIETEVKLLLAINQKEDNGSLVRRFYTLDLEISRVSFFSLSWTVVHALTPQSPLHGFTKENILDSNTEFLVLVKGTDEANQQLVHARRSYTGDDLIWNARFSPAISKNEQDGIPRVQTRHIGRYDILEDE
ncbi:MAG: ion channel [Saprospiraceae bacterium]